MKVQSTSAKRPPDAVRQGGLLGEMDLVELLGMSNLTSKGCDVIEECLSRDCLCYVINRTPT
jgi:hypothetical protein